jgi:hypothetical protein
VGIREGEEEGTGAGERDEAFQRRAGVAQLQGSSGRGDVHQGIEEGVEAHGVAEGHGGDIDVDGTDAVVQAPLQ